MSSWPTEIRLSKDRRTLHIAFEDGASFALPAGSRAEPRPVLVAVRPEKISIGGGGGRTAIACKVEETTFTGALTQLKARPLAAPQTTLLVKMASDPSRLLPERGAEMILEDAAAA